MANEVLPATLDDALASIGNAHAYMGSFTVANSAVQMGQKMGDIQNNSPEPQVSNLTAEEITGAALHDQIILGGGLEIVIPMVVPADGSFWTDFSPVGVPGDGFSIPQRPTFTSVAIIPDWEVGGGLKYAAATWTRLAGNGVAAASGAGAAPKNALWIWKASVRRGNPAWSIQNGGRMIVPVTVTGFWRKESTTGNALPEGHHIYTFGDPAALGVTGFLFSQT